MTRLLGLALAGLATLAAASEVPRAARTLRVGTIVSAADLAAPASSAAIDALSGLEVRRVIYVGRPVRAADLGPPTLVHRNEIVTMELRMRSLSLRTEGRALDAGGAGERIRVLNLESRTAVIATVIAPGRVGVSR